MQENPTYSSQVDRFKRYIEDEVDISQKLGFSLPDNKNFRKTVLRNFLANESGFSFRKKVNIGIGNIIYRITDFLPEFERKEMRIWETSPFPFWRRGGTIRDMHGVWWLSLEDWRIQWRRDNPEIPELAEMWPEADKYFSLFQKLFEESS